jgi:hypothetical protein
MKFRGQVTIWPNSGALHNADGGRRRIPPHREHVNMAMVRSLMVCPPSIVGAASLPHDRAMINQGALGHFHSSVTNWWRIDAVTRAQKD